MSTAGAPPSLRLAAVLRPDAVAGALARRLGAERERWALWLPVCLGVGIGAYFALPAEPEPWTGAGTLAVAAVVATLARRRPLALLAALAIGAGAFGFAVAQWRTAAVRAPVLEARIGPTTVVGRVVSAEALADGTRLVVERLRIRGVAAERMPERARLRLRGDGQPPTPGQWVQMRAVMAPPPPPAAPGAFDYPRQVYFQGIGAVGFGLGAATITDQDPPRGFAAVGAAIEGLRQRITARIEAALDGTRGAMAAALITGIRSTIPEPVLVAMRNSGLAHLLAISGLHIGLVAGTLFIGVRGTLALVPALALRFAIKKWAAMAALVGAFGYALISGATVPTQRAFLMIALVLAAVLFDRQALSMRLVAFAAVVILSLTPENLLGASFQLSFAAVIALVAVWEEVRARRLVLTASRSEGWLRRLAVRVAGVALTTLVASMATAPFAIYHFDRLALYALAANMVAVPITALWVMPWAVLALLVMPFGLEAVALAPMGWGIGVIVAVAEAVASWPGAVTLVPAMPTWGLAAMALGGAWLCLWRGRWRWWGMLGLATGILSLLAVRPPDVLVDGRGRLAAVRTASGEVAVSSLVRARFQRDVWMRRMGEDDEAESWPATGRAARGALVCDSMGCILRSRGHVVALVRETAALAEDCWIADVVVSPFRVRGRCRGANVVIDGENLRRDGAHALWLEEGRVRIESVNAHRGDRPWVTPPPARRGSD